MVFLAPQGVPCRYPGVYLEVSFWQVSALCSWLSGSPWPTDLSTVAPEWEVIGFLRKTTYWMLISFSLKKQRVNRGRV